MPAFIGPILTALARFAPMIAEAAATGTAGSAASAGAGAAATGAAAGAGAAEAAAGGASAAAGGGWLSNLMGRLFGGAFSAAGASSSGASGAAAGQSGASSGGGGLLGRMFGGGAEAFGSSKDLGAALQRLEDIGSIVNELSAANQSLSEQQHATAAKFRDDERLYMTGDPADTEKLAELERQRAANVQQQASMRREAAALEARVKSTTSPPDRTAGLGPALTGAGLVAGVANIPPPSHDPSLAGNLAAAAGDVATAPAGPFSGVVRHLPGVREAGIMTQAAIQPAADLAVGREEGQVAGSGAGVAGGLAKNVGMAALMPALAPIFLTRAAGDMSKMPGLIRDWGEALVESKRGLVQFNGTIAAAFAEAERRGIVRSMATGASTGGATSGLSDSLQDLYDEVRPIKDAVTIVLSRGVESAVRHLTLGIQLLKNIHTAVLFFSPGLRLMEKAVELLGKGDGAMPFDEFIRDVKDRKVGSGPRVPRKPRP